jgi:hypothetical protein
MKTHLWRALTLVMVLAMILPLAAVAQSDAPQGNRTVLAPPGGEVMVEPDPMSKLDSGLRELAAAGGQEPVLVYILTKPDADLSRTVNVVEARAFPPNGELVVARVTPDKILKMASDPNVLAAEVFVAIDAPDPLAYREGLTRPTREQVQAQRDEVQAAKEAWKTNPDSLTPRAFPMGAAPEGGNAVQDWNGADLIGAPAAWAKGFTGEGVNIAIIDSGVDFGHPDLEGRQATYEGGPYDGWPIALDPRSMREYYYNGRTSSHNYYDWWDHSWYADVPNVLRCLEGETSFDFNGYTYSIDASIVALSKSGVIRWGIHPDEQFADFVYDWVPFILLDTVTAGQYDTVIADLNFDFWFDGYDDVATKADPVLNQDLGSYVYTDTVVMTGTVWSDPFMLFIGVPPTWWGPDYVSAGIETVPAGSWIWALDHYSAPGATDGADGMPEVSGGMIYYIADGKLPVPGMDYLYPGIGPAGMLPIPLNGQLVAFMIGSYWAGGGEHGTLCASASAAGGVAQGHFAATGEWVQYDPEDDSNFLYPPSGDPDDMMPWLKPADTGTVQGPAPGAKIIAIGDNYEVVNDMQGFYDAYTFLAYGVDGAPNSGDEFVDIASMSYGDGTVHNDGWDWESRLLSYYNENYLPHTTFFASSGNGGPGFGTINSPQGNTTVSVGASTQYGASTVWGSALSAEQINDGEVVHFSGRGPDAMGRPDPDVVATGGWGAGNVPLNLAPGYAAFASWYVQDGHQAWYEWGGTSRAAPEAAGVMALVYDAYKQAHGAFPDYETARQILMASADDLNHDVLMQGAGRVNADRATDVAGGLAGVSVSPSLLAAGDYQGTAYESFAHILHPGDTWSQTFTVSNSGAATTATIGDEVLQEMETLTYEQVVRPYLGTEGPYPYTYYYSADYFVGSNPAVTTHGADLAVPVPAGADFMQVVMVHPFELFDFSYTDPNPLTVSYSRQQRWSLTVFDWTDRNGDGKLWEDTNADGVVSVDYGDVVDISSTGAVTQTELSRFTYAYNWANIQEATVRLGDRPDIDNIVIGLVHNSPNSVRPGWGAAEYEANPILVKVIFYQKADWDLVTTSTTSLSVPAGGSATFDATFAIPADQAPGLYEGAITVSEGGHTTIIPTTVNVAVPSDELLFDLGGADDSGTPYNNGRMGAGYTWSGVLEEGDWRYFFYDAAAGFDQQYLYVRNQWGDVCVDMPTANETVLWGPNPGDQFSMLQPDRFGPYGMMYAGGTWDAYGPQTGWYNPRRGDWWWGGDSTPLPETRVWGSLWDGLNEIEFRNILLSGKEGCGEGAFEATAGVLGVDAPASGIQIDATQASGSFTLDAVSPVDGLIAYASGFGQEEWFRNQDVRQGASGDLWPDDLMSGWVHTFEATNLSGIQIQTFGPKSSDIDLYLLFDANGDGLFNPYDNREALDYAYSSSSNESIWYWGDFSSGYMIQNGTYAVVMYGYYVQPGDQFDLKLVTFGGDALNVAGANADNNYVLDVVPGQTESLTVNWEVPGSGVWSGYLLFAMPWEEQPTYWAQGPYFYVPVTINYLGLDMSLSAKTVDKDKVCMRQTGEHEILTYLIEVVNNGNTDVWAEVADLLPEGAIYYVQPAPDTAVPNQADFSGGYVAKWWYENGEEGYLMPDENGYIRWEGMIGPSISGSLYIEYQVKVEHGFTGVLLNKADVTISAGSGGIASVDRIGDSYTHSLALKATTNVFYCYSLPVVHTP